MRIPKLFHVIAKQFSAMDDTEAEDLYSEALADYKKSLIAAQTKKYNIEAAATEDAKHINEPDYKSVAQALPKLTVGDKVLLAAEDYKFRYFNNFLYIFLVPKIRAYTAGDEGEESEVNQMGQFFQVYQMMQAMNEQNKRKKM